MRWTATALLLPCLAAAAFGAQDAPPAAPPQRWSVVPALGFGAETSLFAGAMVVHYPTAPPATRSSALPLVALASIKGQYQAFFVPDVYTRDDGYHIEAELSAESWPADAYRPGNDSRDEPTGYTADGFGLELSAQRRIGGAFFAGPVVRYVRDEVSWDDGSARPVWVAAWKGDRGGSLSGVGLVAGYDTRDRPNAPTSGAYVTLRLDEHRGWLGSDYDYGARLLETRRYVPWAKGRVLAFAADLRSVDSAAPFREWSSPDGTGQLRGIENGRYRDRALLSLQAELRCDLPGDFGAVAFVDAARVAPSLGELSPGGLRAAVGMGGRYTINPETGFALRCDMSWVDGAPGVGLIAGDDF